MTYLWIAGGILLLLLGGEALVRGSVSLARTLNVSDLVIGIVLLGFCTTMPEMVTTLQAVQRDEIGLAVGALMGSGIGNILLVLGLAALICPVTVAQKAISRDGAMMLLAIAGFLGLLWFDAFTQPAGLVLLAALLGFLAYSVVADNRNSDEAAALHAAVAAQLGKPLTLPLAIILVLGGLGLLVGGSFLLIDGASALARTARISETVIGLTIVALGASLPEIAICLVAAFRRKSDLALGNVVGANIFALLGITGVAALLKPFSIAGDIGASAMVRDGASSLVTSVHAGAMMLSALLFALFALSGRQISRLEGAVLLLAFGLYLGLLFGLVPVPGLLPDVR